MYLNEIDQSESEAEKEYLQNALIYSMDNFLMSTSDLVMAFHKILYCLAKHPHVQGSRKLQCSFWQYFITLALN